METLPLTLADELAPQIRPPVTWNWPLLSRAHLPRFLPAPGGGSCALIPDYSEKALGLGASDSVPLLGQGVPRLCFLRAATSQRRRRQLVVSTGIFPVC